MHRPPGQSPGDSRRGNSKIDEADHPTGQEAVDEVADGAADDQVQSTTGFQHLDHLLVGEKTC
jgi:hypothetical protein